MTNISRSKSMRFNAVKPRGANCRKSPLFTAYIRQKIRIYTCCCVQQTALSHFAKVMQSLDTVRNSRETKMSTRSELNVTVLNECQCFGFVLLYWGAWIFHLCMLHFDITILIYFNSTPCGVLAFHIKLWKLREGQTSTTGFIETSKRMSP